MAETIPHSYSNVITEPTKKNYHCYPTFQFLEEFNLQFNFHLSLWLFTCQQSDDALFPLGDVVDDNNKSINNSSREKCLYF